METDQLDGFIDFDLLPEEVLIQIFSCFDLEDLAVTSRVCSDWRRLTEDTTLWRRLALVHFPYAYRWLASGYDQSSKRGISSFSPHTLSLLASSNFMPEAVDWRRALRERKRIHKNWHNGTCKTTFLKGHRSTVFNVSVVGDNRLISSGDDGSIRFWNIRDKLCEQTVEGTHTSGLLGMYWDPSSGRILSGSYDGTVKVWDINLDRRTRVDKMSARELKEILDRKKVYYGDCIEKSDLVSRLLTSHAMPVLECRFQIKEHNATIVGTHAMAGLGATAGHDSFINVFNFETGAPLCKLAAHVPTSAVQFYDQGRRLCSGGHDGVVHVWNVEQKGPEFSLRQAHNGWIWHLAYNEASRLLVTGSVDGTVRIWDASTSALIRILRHTREVSGLWVDWTRHMILSASFSGEVLVHDLRTGGLLGRVRGSGERCTRLTCNLDQMFVGSFDGTIGCYDFSAL